MSSKDWRAVRTPQKEAEAIKIGNVVSGGVELLFPYPLEKVASGKMTLPELAGVYLFENVRGYVHYVGSSHNLSKRLGSRHHKIKEALRVGAITCSVAFIPHPMAWAVEQRVIDHLKPDLNESLYTWWNAETQEALKPVRPQSSETWLEDLPCLAGMPKNVEDVNNRLKSVKCKVRVVSRSTGTLSLRSTFPPKPSSDRVKDYQQTLPLKLRDSSMGLKIAEKEALIADHLLMTNKFRWSRYLGLASTKPA